MSLTKVSYSMISGSSANILDFGAISGTDCTTAIQAAINSGASEIIYPAGTYLCGPLTLVSNQKHLGTGGILQSTNTGVNMMSGISVNNITIDGLIFNSSDVVVSCIAFQGTLSPASNCSNIIVQNCVCTGGIQLFSTYQPSGSTYSTILTTMETTNVQILNNRVVGTTASLTGGGIGGIALYYAINCLVSNNIVESMQHGITWWGGDSAPGANGALSNTRKTYDITITGNIVLTMGGGGIFGSMGNNMSITGNMVSGCTDVGIDLEGNFNTVVSGNYVFNCNNGCLVTYHYVKGILFSGNNCVQATDGQNIIMHNISGSSYGVDVTYTGNYLACQTSSGYGIAIANTPSISNVMFSNNNLVNVKIQNIVDGAYTATYTGNNLLFQQNYGSQFYAINVQNIHAGVQILDNVFKTLSSQYSTSAIVYMASYNYGSLESHTISNNVFQEESSEIWPTDVIIVNNSTVGSSGVIRYSIKGNKFGNYSISGTTPLTITSTNGIVDNIILTSNVDSYNNPYPYYVSSAPSGTWTTGQIAYSQTPASGGYIGAVCTAGGTPGTWKTFGAIS